MHRIPPVCEGNDRLGETKEKIDEAHEARRWGAEISDARVDDDKDGEEAEDGRDDRREVLVIEGLSAVALIIGHRVDICFVLFFLYLHDSYGKPVAIDADEGSFRFSPLVGNSGGDAFQIHAESGYDHSHGYETENAKERLFPGDKDHACADGDGKHGR